MKSSMLWGTYGKYNELPLTWKPITDLATDHIVAILVTQPQVPAHYHDAFVEILKSRGYRWIGPKATEWHLRPLAPYFHAPGWVVKNTHHPCPLTATPEELAAERAAKEQFYDLLFKLVEGPMFAMELK